MSDYRTEAPEILRDFLSYHETIKAHSQRTVDEYYLDLRNFFRYMKQIRDPDLADKSLDEISIMDVDQAVGHLQLHDLSQPGSGPVSEQLPFGLRPERRVPCQKNRHDPLLLQLPDQQGPPTS